MRLFIIVAVSILLASFPLLISFFFLAITLPRKMLAVKQDMSKLSGTGDGGPPPPPGAGDAHSQFYSASDIEGLAKKYFATSTLTIPSLLLVGLYFAFFMLCDSYLRYRFVDRNTWFFPEEFVKMSVPLLYAFVGVFLFNLGTMVRRLYLADINEQVFWGAVNRLLLSMGLALVIMKSGIEGAKPWLYFSIGFMANIVLDWVLEKTLKLLDLGQPKQPELPLQMVRGINIWKEYRLEEESIENVQNLATADVVDLTVRTHYSARTLIDWIDQAIVLSRLTAEQVKAMASQATALSAIELAQASPENNNGDRTFSDALAAKLNVDPVLMAATLDRLYEDEYVRNLWELWQSGTESATSKGVPMPPKTKAAAVGGDAAPATGAAGATGTGH